jgi:murein DD-endopeptidase MepM/ murein hydrolase activator NlpD
MATPKYRNIKKLGTITTPYGGNTRGEAVHPGVDIANKEGTPVPALADGVITAVEPKDNGMGNTVTLQDSNGDTHQYGHLRNSIVKAGQRVRRGEQIAAMGQSGNSYSPSGGDPSHLDIRIVSAYGKWKNPMTYVKSFI